MSEPAEPVRRRRGSIGLTRRGFTLAGSAAGLLLGGRALGADELSLLGLAALLLLAGAVAWVLLAPSGLTVTRQVVPGHLHVGDHARIDLNFRAPARRRSPLVDLTESIDDQALRARFLVAPLDPGATEEAAYRLPTERRGPLTLGPAVGVRTDPLGLARGARTVAPADEVLVRPRVFGIGAAALGAGRRIAADAADAARAQSPDNAGDFLAVRPYETGDDPRHVHWRSSARTDELMVRQYVAPRRGRTLVLLDTRAPGPTSGPALGHDHRPDRDAAGGAAPVDAAFERAVEAAASVVVNLQRLRRPVVRRTTSGSVLSLPGSDPDHRVLDRLARVARDEPDLLAAIAEERMRPAPELVVLVTPGLDAPVHAALARFATASATALVVTGGAAPTARIPATVIDARVEPFPAAWQRAARPSRSPVGVPWTSAATSRPPSHSQR